MQKIDLYRYLLLSNTMWICFFMLACTKSEIMAQGHDFAGNLVTIHDGDRITISYHDTKTAIPVRLYGIDAPEKGQPYWQEAKDFLHNLLIGKWVKVATATEGTEEELIGIVNLPNETMANEELVKAGLAWVNEAIKEDLALEKLRESEREARQSKRGLWADPDPTPPWVYRKTRGE